MHFGGGEGPEAGSSHRAPSAERSFDDMLPAGCAVGCPVVRGTQAVPLPETRKGLFQVLMAFVDDNDFDVDDFEGARVTMQVSGQTYLNTFALDPRNVHRDILALAAVFVLLAGACWLRLHVRFAMQRRRGGCFGG